MLGRKTINEKRSAGAVKIVTGLFTAVLALLFVMSFANQAGSQAFNFNGTILAIDSDSKILTLVQCGTNEKLTFAWHESASVTMGGDFKSFEDLNVGDNVTVGYFQASDGSYVAGDIDMTMRAETC